MITVEQLKQSRKDATDLFLEELSLNIQARNSKGVGSYQAAVPGGINVDQVFSELEKAGFTVARNKGSDWRDGAWDYLVITWAENQ